MFKISLNRVYLRELSISDLDPLLEILSDPETMQYYPAPYPREKVLKWIEKSIDSYRHAGFGLWGVILKKNNTLIGQCGISNQNINGAIVPEIGYHIHKLHWNQGYATESAVGCLHYGFDQLGLKEIFIHTSVDNLPSSRVAEKLRMTKRFIYDKEIPACNIKMMHVVYSMTKEEFDHLGRF